MFSKLSNGLSMEVSFKTGNIEHKTGYYLEDVIYPKWKTLMKGYRVPRKDKEMYLMEKVASYRKDITYVRCLTSKVSDFTKPHPILWRKSSI